jgi:hypothetical protein
MAETPVDRATPRKIQPIGLLGCRDATSAPTVAKATAIADAKKSGTESS